MVSTKHADGSILSDYRACKLNSSGHISTNHAWKISYSVHPHTQFDLGSKVQRYPPIDPATAALYTCNAHLNTLRSHVMPHSTIFILIRQSRDSPGRTLIQHVLLPHAQSVLPHVMHHSTIPATQSKKFFTASLLAANIKRDSSEAIFCQGPQCSFRKLDPPCMDAPLPALHTL